MAGCGWTGEFRAETRESKKKADSEVGPGGNRAPEAGRAERE